MGIKISWLSKNGQNGGSISTRNSHTTERQIALFQNYSIEELDKQISRLAWLYAVGVIDDDTLQEIISKNEKKEIVILQLDDLFFREGATFRYLFATDWYDNCENTDVIAFSDWNNLPKKEKQDFPNAVVEFFIDGSDVCERYESKDSGGEGSGIVRRFRKAFRQLAEAFTDYYAASGVKKYTKVVPEVGKTNNVMPVTYFGASDQEPFMGVTYNFAVKALEGMPEEKARELAYLFSQVIELLRVETQAFIDYVDATYGGVAVTAPPNQGEKTVLDCLTEVMQAEKNESLRLRYGDRVEGMRSRGMSDAEIVKNLSITSWCKSYAATAQKNWEDWQKANSSDTTDSAAGNNSSQKTPPTPTPAPVSAPTSGSGKGTTAQMCERLRKQYGMKFSAITPTEWKLTVFAGEPEAQRDFEPGQPLGGMNLCDYDIVDLIMEYSKNSQQPIPKYLMSFLDAEIRRINQGN